MMAYILAGARTPNGSFMGSLSSMSAPSLGAVAINGVLRKSGVSPDKVEEVFMGNVVQAGVGQAPARQAAIFAGLPESIPCTTINKVCGSGMKTIIMASQTIAAGDCQVVIAGGMENMSKAPHLISRSRKGIKFGHGQIQDALLHDGLWDVYTDRAMGNCAEECVKKYNFSRQAQDEYAMESFKRAQKAAAEGIFDSEIVPVSVKNAKSDDLVKKDEGPSKVQFAKIPKLPAVFEKEGSITAANASTINDGAAAILLAGEEYKKSAKFKIVSYAGHAGNPTWFTTAPVTAMKKCAAKANIKLSDIDLFEINEAFAIVPMLVIKELSLDHNKVNIYGGGVSLGHPIGNSGCRIVITLINAMERNNSSLGMASICIGGGEALALLLEKL
ncbi:MAG: thiolase family protein [Halobacteriovoraceae bacterium]|nr:thiolase family protein [Halobacteriovoraceae bacterium]